MGQACSKYVQNMLKKGDLLSHFRFFLNDYRLSATIKFLVILPVIDSTSRTKNDFSSSMFSTKISDLTKKDFL